MFRKRYMEISMYHALVIDSNEFDSAHAKCDVQINCRTSVVYSTDMDQSNIQLKLALN